MKQVVQGWIYKSDQDRREAHLYIDGPGWSELVSFQLKSSMVTLPELHQLTEAINRVAHNSEAIHVEIRERIRAAKQDLAAALLNRSVAETAAFRLVSVAENDARVSAYAAQVEALLAEGVGGEQKSRRTAARVKRIRAELHDIGAAARGEAQSAADEGARARQEAERLQAEVADSEPSAPDPSGEEVIERTAPLDDHDVVFEQLRKLAELRDEGILTEAEFSQKKTDLLDRM